MRPVSTMLAAALALSAPAAPPEADAAVVRRLVEALKDPDPEVRQNLAVALAKIGPPVVESLTEALKDAAPERRAGAAYALGLIGPPARAALPDLLAALSDKDTEVRRQVSYAISRVVRGGKPAEAAPVPTVRGGL